MLVADDYKVIPTPEHIQIKRQFKEIDQLLNGYNNYSKLIKETYQKRILGVYDDRQLYNIWDAKSRESSSHESIKNVGNERTS